MLSQKNDPGKSVNVNGRLGDRKAADAEDRYRAHSEASNLN
jgi:hypothetical protein